MGDPGESEGAVIVLFGWAFSLLIVQILSLVFAISGWVAIPSFLAGLILAFPAARASLISFIQKPFGVSAVLKVSALILIAAWVASRGMYRIENFDSGLYHLPTIRWLNTYAIVPGLGNLHGRLAFNQSFFSYVASLNASWFPSHGRSAANGFLYLVVLLQAIQGLTRHWRNVIRDDGPRTLTWAADLLVLPILVYIGLSSEGLSSPTPDLAATLLHLSMFLVFVRGVSVWRSGGSPDFAVAVLPFLAATAITVKLSTVAFAGSLVIACVIYSIHSSQGNTKALRRAFIKMLPAGAVVGVWLARGVILSGCPVYPATIGCVAVDWKVPTEKIVNEANWVYSWAREPFGGPEVVLASWNWFGPWMSRQLGDVLEFVFPLAMSLAFLVCAVAVRAYMRKKSGRSSSTSDVIVLVPVVVGIVFWFVTAPDPRFGRSLFWMLLLSGGLLFLASLENLVRRRTYRTAALGVCAIISAPFFAYVIVNGTQRITRISTSGWHPIPVQRVVARRTSSGLLVYVPEGDERCWDSALPCTPYFNSHLSLRKAGKLQGGFVDRTPLRRSEAALHP